MISIWGTDKDKIKGLLVIIRDGDYLKLAKGKLLKDGSIIADGKAYILKEYKPMIIKTKWGTYECLILDAKKELVYTFTNNINGNDGNGKIESIPVDPILVKQFLNSNILQKLAAAKPDNFILILVFFMGMFVFMLLSQFLLNKGG